MKQAAMVIACALLVAACMEPKRRLMAHFAPAPLIPSGPVQYCFDGSPWISNAVPFVWGGRDLSLPRNPEVAAAYKQLGIVWGCPADANGYGSHGPHVAFGGRCLDPPPPGTREYNDIVMGVGVTNWLYPLWRACH